ncbi:MAG: alpha/beta hydrolase [Pseudomonas sp.]|jgi:alpha-beta hydrolase superfamily lysophospholipase|nr:alpha/beta hydrolase [Pseudomonas sp.]
MSNTFNPELLQRALPAFDKGSVDPQLAQVWRRFYQIDFAQQHPDLHSRLGAVDVLGYRIAMQVWRPPQALATLLVLHGYYDHMGLYGHVYDWALRQGFAVLSCDLPGHGLSTGVRASINSFQEYQQVLQALLAKAEQLHLPKPWHILGQSTGAAIAVDYLLNQDSLSPLGETILLAPLVRPRAWQQSKLLYQLVKPFRSSVRRHFSDNSHDSAFVEFVRNDPLQAQVLPTAWVGALAQWIPSIEQAQRSSHSPIVVQGDADMTVDWQHNLNILTDKFSAPRILLLPEARHHLANEKTALREQYFQFLTEQLT